VRLIPTTFGHFIGQQYFLKPSSTRPNTTNLKSQRSISTSAMESRNEKVIRLIGLVAANGSQFNDLKLEKLLKIVEQPDINIEIDHDSAGAPTTGTKRAPDNPMEGEGLKKKRGVSSVSARVS
jgi:hypothetical protein